VITPRGGDEEAERTVDRAWISEVKAGRARRGVTVGAAGEGRWRSWRRRGWASGSVTDISYTKDPKRNLPRLPIMVTQSSCTTRSIHVTLGAAELLPHPVPAGCPSILLPFAIGNLLGPLILGPLFDTGAPAPDDPRHCYGLAGIVLASPRRCQRRLVERPPHTRSYGGV